MSTSPKQKLNVRAFLALKTPHSPDVSPNGRRVVFAVTEADHEESRWVSRLWIADTDEQGARQITFSYEGERDPRWSPDGKHIAFLSARPDMTEPPPTADEEEDLPKEQVWVMPSDGGEARRLTRCSEGVTRFEWMPDGATIVYLTSEERPPTLQHAHDDARKRKNDAVVEYEEKLRRQFWDVDLEHRKPELIFTGDFGISDFDVSPDGRGLVFCTNHSGEPNDQDSVDLYLLDVDGGEPRQLGARGGSKLMPRWCPDGGRIAYIAPLEESVPFSQACIWTIGTDGLGERALTGAADFDVHGYDWSRGSDGLVAQVAVRTHEPIARIDEDRVVIVPATADAVAVDFAVGPEGLVVAVLEDERRPPELYVIGSDGDAKALTEFGSALCDQYAVPQSEVVSWLSDGREIEGILSRPATDPPWPLVVQVHGGPHARNSSALDSYSMHAVWSAEGYAVLRPNFRGSEGYGNEFAVAIRRDLAEGPFRDIDRGVDVLVDRGLADPGRIGIMGGSYGGYMTNWAVSHSDRYRAAISMFGVFSLVSDYGNSEIACWERDYLGAWYWDEPELYAQLSPACYVDRIQAPVLIIHGESDTNTFISNSRELYRALRDRGAVVRFIRYPREGHGIVEPCHRIDEMTRCLGWFDRHVMGDGRQVRCRAEEAVVHEGYELRVLRVQDAEPDADEQCSERLIEVAVVVGSTGPVSGEWAVPVEDIVLVSDEVVQAPRGVFMDTGQVKTLVEGTGLLARAQPDRETGRISFGLSLAYSVPWHGGVFRLRLADMPDVELIVTPKEPESTDDAQTGETE